MAVNIVSVQEALDDTGLKMLVHSPAGHGKTVLCATAGKPTLIISAEAGLLSIKDAPKYVKVVVIKTIDDLDEVYDMLVDGSIPCSWVCLDSISEIAEVLLSEEKNLTNDARQAYGKLSERMLKKMRQFRDLADMNVLFTCKQKRLVDGESGAVSYVPSLPGNALTEAIAYMFDFVFALRVEEDDEGNKYRVLQTEPDKAYQAKSRGEYLEDFEKPSLKQLEMKIRGDDYVPYVKKTKEEKEAARIEKLNHSLADEDQEAIDAEDQSVFEEGNEEKGSVIPSEEEIAQNDRDDHLGENIEAKEENSTSEL